MSLALEYQERLKKVFRWFNLYKARYFADGCIVSNETRTRETLRNIVRPESVVFGWEAIGASKKRTSGIYQFYTKLCGFIGVNATQTTESSQPYEVGTIAPNELPAMYNPNGGSRFLTHPTISFAANRAWTVTTVLNKNGRSIGVAYPFLYGNNQGSASSFTLEFQSTNIFLRFWNKLNTTVIGTKPTSKYNGKTIVLSLVAMGNSTLNYYVNGILEESLSISTEFDINYLLRGINTTSYEFTGKVYAHYIRNIALSASEVATEAAQLRAKYPEIPSVVISGITAATSRLDVVCNAAGTVIADATVTETWTTGAAGWCYHSGGQGIEGKLYNKAAREVIKAAPPEGWHVATKAELQTISSGGANSLKVSGLAWWNTASGTNTTGLSLIGLTSRLANGTFNTFKNSTSIWCANVDEVMLITHDSDTVQFVATGANEGHSILLIKN